MRYLRNIYLVRHCEPQINRGISICLGKTDVPLSEKGIIEANLLQKYFSKINLSYIYSSPLNRAKQTAEIIAYNKLKVEIKKNLSELNMGKWDGMNFAEIKDEYPLEYKMRGEDFENFVVEGGESMINCQKRAYEELLSTVKESSGNILIVAHAGVIRTILSKITDSSIKDSFALKLEYGSINKLTYDGEKFVVDKIGESLKELHNERSCENCEKLLYSELAKAEE